MSITEARPVTAQPAVPTISFTLNGQSVQTLADPKQLAATATQAKPMLVFVDLDDTGGKDSRTAVKQLKENPATAHIPVVGFTMEAAG